MILIKYLLFFLRFYISHNMCVMIQPVSVSLWILNLKCFSAPRVSVFTSCAYFLFPLLPPTFVVIVIHWFHPLVYIPLCLPYSVSVFVSWCMLLFRVSGSIPCISSSLMVLINPTASVWISSLWHFLHITEICTLRLAHPSSTMLILQYGLWICLTPPVAKA